MVALFDYNGRLYQIEGKARPSENDATAMLSDSCNHSYYLAAVLITAPRTKFELPRQLAADQTGLEAPRQSRVTAAVLKFAAVASNRSPLTALNSGDLSGAHKPIHRLANSTGLQIPTGHSRAQ